MTITELRKKFENGICETSFYDASSSVNSSKNYSCVPDVSNSSKLGNDEERTKNSEILAAMKI